MSPRGPDSRHEEGFTLPEILVAIGISTVVALALFTFVNTTSRTSARVSERIAANQSGRLGMQRLMDELHSTCIFPGLAPVLPGSTDTAIGFIHGTGSQANVAPVATGVPLTPHRRIVYFSGNRLYDLSYDLRSDSPPAPDWTFNYSPSDVFTLVSEAGQATSGSTKLPVFRYYAYVNGAISPAPLSVPLSSDDAKKVVQVTVTFTSAGNSASQVADDGNAVTLSDQALLRFSPSNEDTSKAGLPCT